MVCASKFFARAHATTSSTVQAMGLPLGAPLGGLPSVAGRGGVSSAAGFESLSTGAETGGAAGVASGTDGPDHASSRAGMGGSTKPPGMLTSWRAGDASTGCVGASASGEVAVIGAGGSGIGAGAGSGAVDARACAGTERGCGCIGCIASASADEGPGGVAPSGDLGDSGTDCAGSALLGGSGTVSARCAGGGTAVLVDAPRACGASSSSSLSSLISSIARGVMPGAVLRPTCLAFEMLPGSPSPLAAGHAPPASCSWATSARLFCALRASAARAAARAAKSGSASFSSSQSPVRGLWSSDRAWSMSFIVECSTPGSAAEGSAEAELRAPVTIICAADSS